jgi:hypothetical protein
VGASAAVRLHLLPDMALILHFHFASYMVLQ